MCDEQVDTPQCIPPCMPDPLYKSETPLCTVLLSASTHLLPDGLLLG